MKKLQFLFLLTLAVQQSLFSQCNSGSITVATNTVITGSCIITGDITILNGATLNVDLTGVVADTFVVRGNILLLGNAVLWVHADSGSRGEQFIVSNSFSGERNLTSRDSSRLILEHIEFRTQEGNLTNAASIYMNCSVEDSSIFYINGSRLDREKAWLLCDLKNNSTLLGYDTDGVPTELYIQDAVQVVLGGLSTELGIWLNFDSITDTLTLPPDVSQPFSWKIGRGFGGLSSLWYLQIDTARVGFGAQIFPTTQMVFNGTGLPVTGEFKVALLFANNTDTIKNLVVGLQNTTVANGITGFVTLNNVNLGPIAWQLYALINENLYVKNSIVNEIGIAGPSTVTVDSCLLQLAVVAAVGMGGSTMIINNSQLWNQSITATNNSSITLNNCEVYGSAFSTTDAVSDITVNGGCFFTNPSGCTQNTMVNITTGQPYCNPFIPPGLPQILTPATITLNGVNNNCVIGINETENIDGVTIFPNPAKENLNIFFPDNQKQQIQIFNAMGMLLKEVEISQPSEINISDLSGGLYFIRVKANATETQKFIKQ